MNRLIVFAAITAVFNLPVSAQEPSETGLLIMAHGGDSTWNDAVTDAVAVLADRWPTVIAFGMANRVTLQEAVDELERQHVVRIGVVRLFMSSKSFLETTEYLFGNRDRMPEGGHRGSNAMPLAINTTVHINEEGLLDEPGFGAILAERALALSTKPSSESVLILGHGPGDDAENEDWLYRMDRMADSVRSAADFHSVMVNTLREDWTEKREAVEIDLRTFVQRETDAGRSVLVVPFRLHGFGPYAAVLDGLPYRADSLGFLPHPLVTEWIREQFEKIRSDDALN